VTILGDARLAERLVGNLVDSSLRHNLPGGTVTVSCTADDDCMVRASSTPVR
jgi:signal transduction histidine kinase